MARPSVTRSGGLMRFQVALRKDEHIVGALNEAALAIRTRARRKIRSGGASGEVYQVGAQTFHRASAPGQSPANFTGTLADRIRVQKAKVSQGSRKVAFVAAGAPHAHLLEFGTVKMAARPFFGPAIAETRGDYKQLIRKAADKAIRKAARAAAKGRA